MIADKLVQTTVEAVSALYNQNIEKTIINIQKTNLQYRGTADFTLMVFPLVRYSKKSPEQTAGELGEYLMQHLDFIEKYSVVKGFLNIRITGSYWIDFLKSCFSETDFGIQGEDTTKPPVIVEYSSPNTNKPLHLGHIRNGY